MDSKEPVVSTPVRLQCENPAASGRLDKATFQLNEQIDLRDVLNTLGSCVYNTEHPTRKARGGLQTSFHDNIR